MTKIEIINTIKQLAKSQGYYCRLYNELMYFAKNDPISYNEYMETLTQTIKTHVDLILHFEG
jgi:hypothetical protein